MNGAQPAAFFSRATLRTLNLLYPVAPLEGLDTERVAGADRPAALSFCPEIGERQEMLIGDPDPTLARIHTFALALPETSGKISPNISAFQVARRMFAYYAHIGPTGGIAVDLVGPDWELAEHRIRRSWAAAAPARLRSAL